MAGELAHGTVGTELTQAEFEATTLHVLASQARGDMIYASSTTQLSRLAVGTVNKVLVSDGTDPGWSSTLSGLTLTSPTVNTPALSADSVDAITEIAAALKSGADGVLITGTAGTSGDLAQWNADGDLVDGPTPPSGTIVGTTDTQTLSGKTLTDPVFDNDLLINTGGIINFASGDVTLTHAANLLTLAGGNFNFGANIAFINETANADMTVGLTIQQGANDNDILTFKSSDVAHPITGSREADTFASFRKSLATGGGLEILAISDADASLGGYTLQLIGFAGDATLDTTDTSASTSVVFVSARKSDGGTTTAALASTENLFSIGNTTTVRFLLKGDGTLHATNVTAGEGDLDGVALDDYDDVGLVRTWQRQRWDDAGIAMSHWDNMIQSNKDELIRLGVLSSEGDFIKIQRMFDLQGGAIWQTYTALMEVISALPKSVKAKLPQKIQNKLAALPH